MAIAFLVVLGVVGVLAIALIRESGRAVDAEHREPEPPAPSLPPIRYPVPRQALDTERLLMGPDQRAFEIDELRALWAASPDEPNVRTDLRADPAPPDAT